MQDVGKGAHGQRLGQARDTFEQDVTSRQQSDEQPLDHAILSDDALADLRHHVLHRKRHSASPIFMPMAR